MNDFEDLKKKIATGKDVSAIILIYANIHWFTLVVNTTKDRQDYVVTDSIGEDRTQDHDVCDLLEYLRGEEVKPPQTARAAVGTSDKKPARTLALREVEEPLKATANTLLETREQSKDASRCLEIRQEAIIQQKTKAETHLEELREAFADALRNIQKAEQQGKRTVDVELDTLAVVKTESDSALTPLQEPSHCR